MPARMPSTGVRFFPFRELTSIASPSQPVAKQSVLCSDSVSYFASEWCVLCYLRAGCVALVNRNAPVGVCGSSTSCTGTCGAYPGTTS